MIKTNPDIVKIWRCLVSTMTKVPVVQSLEAGQQEGDCNKTKKVDKTEPFDVIERVLVDVFGDRGHDHCEVDIWHGNLTRANLKIDKSADCAAIRRQTTKKWLQYPQDGHDRVFLVIESGVVGKFRDSSHDHCEDEI